LKPTFHPNSTRTVPGEIFRCGADLTLEMVAEKAYVRTSHIQQAMLTDALRAEPKRIARAAHDHGFGLGE
jgi:hypothetical protein